MNKYFKNLLTCFYFGVLTLILGTITSALFSAFFSADLPDVCKDWNKHYAMEICLFITGCLIYLFT